jgi:replicative DNA helicase
MIELSFLPPQSIDAEQAVLGALILESTAIIDNHINPEWFYKTEHQIIAKQIVNMHKTGKKIDLITVTQKLRDEDLIEQIGGIGAITELTNKVASSAHIKQHLRIIQDKYTRRQIIKITQEVNKFAYNESMDLEDVISKLHSNTLEVMEFNTDTIHSFKDALDILWQRIKQNEQSIGITGIPTGFEKLNRMTGGWQGSDLVVVAGETSQGKTSLVLNFTINAGLKGYSGVIYSLEMSLLQLTARIVSSYTDVCSKRILFESLSPIEMNKINEGIYKLSNMPVYTDDNVNNSIDSICLSIRRMKLKYNIKFAVIDYVQNIKEIAGKNEEGSIGTIMKMLKNLAKELDITIFAVSQLRRNNNSPVPNIQRLRGSGQIEETADIIITVYRPEYYNMEFPEPFETYDTIDKGMITIAKGRNIGTGAFLVNFNKSTTTFTDVLENKVEVDNWQNEF